MSNYPQYQVIEIIALQPLPLPNETIASGTTIFVLEQQTLATSAWGAALQQGGGPGNAQPQQPLNALQAWNNPQDAPNFYIAAAPWWPDIPTAQAAAISDFNSLTAIRNGTVVKAALLAAITSNSYVNLITTVAGPG